MKQFNFNKRTGYISVENYLPHNFLAEKIILNSLLTNNNVIEIVKQNLPVDAFYFKNHQEIYKAILLLYQTDKEITLVNLITIVQDQGIFEKIGGTKVLTEIINQVPDITYLADYIKLLRDKYLRRKLVKLGYQIINSSHITSIPLQNILEDLEKKLFAVTNETNNNTLNSSAELLQTVFTELQEKFYKKSLPGLITGFYDFDTLTQGLQKSDLIILAGRPSMGKTAFALSIAINISKRYKLPILFFSLEMSKEQLMYRLLVHETSISNQKLKTGNLFTKDWDHIIKTIQIFSRLPFFIDDNSTISINEIRLKIKKIMFEYNQVGLIVIDYLQLMQNVDSKSQNRVQELSFITRSLKSIAREFQVPIIALSQLSRNVENRTNKRPILSDLRESGSIEQDADLVLMLYREDYYKNRTTNISLTEIILAKHRNGSIGSFQLLFENMYNRFINYRNE